MTPVHQVIHLLATTPAPVIVRSLPPIAVKSLPPDPIAAQALDYAVRTFWMTVAGVGLAVVAVVVAFAALFVSLDESKRGRIQFAAFMQRPKLVAAITFTETPPVGTQFDEMAVNFEIRNEGDRLARYVMLEVLLRPNDTFSASETAQPREVDGKHCVVVQRFDLKDYLLYPGSAAPQITQNIYVAADLADVDIGFRLYDEFASYPADGYEYVTAQRWYMLPGNRPSEPTKA